MKPLLPLLLLSLLAMEASASDFRKTMGGQPLYFTITAEGQHPTVSVDSPFPGGDYQGMERPQGRLTIPEQVERDGTTYKVTSIAARAFADCEGLQAVTVPVGVTVVGSGAFHNCNNLRSVTLMCDSLALMYRSFEGCYGVDTLILGATVRYLPPFAFAGMGHLAEVRLEAENATAMTNLFFGCRSAARLVVGSRVSAVPDFFCYNFEGLQSVEFVADGHSLATIGQCAFVNCGSLREIVLPSSVTLIGANAFAYCRLQQIAFRSEVPPVLADHPFFGIDSNTHVEVPCGSRQAYANAAVGRFFRNIDYPEGCPKDPMRQEVVYIHDTVYVHDTIYLPETAFREHLAAVNATDADADGGALVEVDYSDAIGNAEPEQWLFLDGRTLRIARALRLRGASVKVYDENGRLVLDDRIPPDHPADNWYLRLPRRKRLYLSIGNLRTIAVDIAGQRVKY